DPPLPREYVVRDGETLWSIAARRVVYRDALLWPLIYRANRDQIKDPRQIFPQQVLTIPRSVSDEEKEAAREKARRSEIFPV
ncbi:MAG: LysM peptidoglycan-binding domain-containing protein, partial [Desulfuromonadales bacterium]|nr:LysM peptidoglycan-binding domain-containing protein [Desulfuromonadales bacterium]NIS40159.1 LysM peptidoglycan-binding domain-containing protein [Desulfuromonadales bacterium]